MSTGVHNRVEWRGMLFDNEARPKDVFTMWLQCHGRLLKVDLLAQWGIQVNSSSALCMTEDETHHHLFGEYRFLIAVWIRLLRWL